MLTIGMLGGMSAQSSGEYYRLANELVAERLGGLHSAQCLLYSVDFATIEELQVAGRWDDAAAVLTRAARAVQAGGADLLVLCTNTMHIVADQIQAGIDIPLLHIVDVTAAAVIAAGLDTVGLLATDFTAQQPFYVNRMRSHGVSVLVPEVADQALVHRVIYDELCRGVVRAESRDGYRDVMRRLVAGGAQGVVLGCTEVELLVGAADIDVPVFPTTRLHVAAAVDRALAGRPHLDHGPA
ncbi:MAG TPA: aspartate/glutamate racemase family protein [Mycobacteriales bacterium]|jgi:aspartate racemase|nr:aspartate/glutamate racemase family protein [Mycobacteriales bacterium]